jgi:ditrans,polycis-polyprenyl diphosphate synthase
MPLLPSALFSSLPDAMLAPWRKLREMARDLVAAALRSRGPIPEHVAIVMDGNRRFAASRSLPTGVGHSAGADKLVDVMRWCHLLGVRVLSVYAFSSENFARPRDELDALFSLAETRFDDLATHPAVTERRVRVRVLGDLASLPKGVRDAAERVTAATAAHDGPRLDVYFAYTGRGDVVGAVNAASDAAAAAAAARRRGGRGGGGDDDLDLDLDLEPATEETLERCMRGGACAEDGTSTTVAVDLLVRTSGETRLSDFTLWGIRRVLSSHTGSRTTASARCTPILEDFLSRRPLRRSRPMKRPRHQLTNQSQHFPPRRPPIKRPSANTRCCASRTCCGRTFRSRTCATRCGRIRSPPRTRGRGARGWRRERGREGRRKTRRGGEGREGRGRAFLRRRRRRRRTRKRSGRSVGAPPPPCDGKIRRRRRSGRRTTFPWRS